MGAVAGAIKVAGEVLQERRDFAQQRHQIILANAELQERELIKMASLSAAMAAALRERGVKERTAALAGEVGVAALKVGFERWVTDQRASDLPSVILECLEELKNVTNEK